MESTTDFRFDEFRAELARRRLPQWRLAADLGMSPTTFSDRIRGKIPITPEFRRNIEVALGLSNGKLSLATKKK